MKRLLIDRQGDTTRIACMTDNKLTEIIIESASAVGHIINGVVKNILPSRFVFIDIGLEKNAFMNLPHNLTLKPGQYIPVQVRKDATANKGASVSEILQFKGRLAMLYKSNKREIGVSSKITYKPERKRLLKLASDLLPEDYSCILRTQSNNASDKALKEEFLQLIELCNATEKKAQHSPAYELLYKEDLILNDLLTDDLNEIITSEDNKNLFEEYDVERQIKKALQRNVWLPCGGFVTFDQVEACVVVDVNSGKFSGKKDYRETVLKVNLEAAQIIAEQITLRNLSGMIIIDFIDMSEDSDKQTLLTFLGQELKKSRIPADIVGMTSLGLVQLTRRKGREPLSKLLQQSCPHCNGSGRILKGD